MRRVRRIAAPPREHAAGLVNAARSCRVVRIRWMCIAYPSNGIPVNTASVHKFSFAK
ncbi:protein of unknown function [Burkholderia multivorans]